MNKKLLVGVTPLLAIAALLLIPAGSSAEWNVYVANFASKNVSQYETLTGGELTSLAPPTEKAEMHPIGVAVSPDGKAVYVTNEGSATVSQYERGQLVATAGVLKPFLVESVATSGTEPEGIATSKATGGTSWAYVASESPGELTEYKIAPDGSLEKEFTIPAGLNASGIAVRPESCAYVTNEAADTISQYEIEPTGKLVARGSVATGKRPIGVAVGGNNYESVYAANELDNTVSQYKIESNCELKPLGNATIATDKAPKAVAATQVYAYVTDYEAAKVSQYQIKAAGGLGEGELEPRIPATVPTGTNPGGIAVTPDERYAYVTNATSNNVWQYEMGQVAGTKGLLKALNPKTEKTGTEPFGIALTGAVPNRPPHWYSNGKLIKEGQVEPVTTGGLLTFHIPPGYVIKCKLQDKENIVNPLEGGAGTDEMTEFALTSCSAKPSPCPKGINPEIIAHKLPWATHLIPGPPVRDVIEGIEVEVKCSNGIVRDVFTGTLMPTLGGSILEFGAGSGALEDPDEPGEKATVTGTDTLKGPAGDQKITGSS